MPYLSDRQVTVLSAALAACREKCENDAAINVEAGHDRVAQGLLEFVTECDELTARLADSRVAIFPPADRPAQHVESGPISFDRGSF